jgi:sugar lactone lactonase YvrE
MTNATEVLIDGLAFPEGPRWHDGKLWFSDMHGRVVLRVDAPGKAEVVVEVPGNPSGLGWLPDGRMLVVSMTDRRLLRLDPDGLAEVADLHSLSSSHCNDMLVDRHGRAYVGNFGFDLHEKEAPRTAEIVLVPPDGPPRVVADEMSFPNGTVVTPDGGTLIVGETFASRLTAFDVEADGSLSGRRVWAQLEGIVPDGICLDAEGAIWVASPVSHAVFRVAEGGEVLQTIPLETQSFACMLGGDDGRTLHICSAEDSHPEICVAKRTGRIETVRVDVPHAGLP